MSCVDKKWKKVVLSRDRIPSKAKRALDFSGFHVDRPSATTDGLPSIELASVPGYLGDGWLVKVKCRDVHWANLDNGIPARVTYVPTPESMKTSISKLLTPFQDGAALSSATCTQYSRQLKRSRVVHAATFIDEHTVQLIDSLIFTRPRFLTDLPLCILHKITFMCDIKTALRLSQRCSLFKSIVDSCSFWEQKLLNDHGCTTFFKPVYTTRLWLLKNEYKELSQMPFLDENN